VRVPSTQGILTPGSGKRAQKGRHVCRPFCCCKHCHPGASSWGADPAGAPGRQSGDHCQV